ncbi:MAG TPA: pantoate--beta-alanine ligase [Bacteroidales bacterium]|nr:pantoate--beta-alanine ligase [Bacteroidales bacterium]HPT11554.1 pantoate--beta-alanine ligase [Bacteroidales bacterium]
MKVFTTISEVKDFKLSVKEGLLGFVPTMGALHNGHLSLVKEAKKRSSFVGVSIFVNPTQFNDLSDLDRYPRTPDADIALLSQVMEETDFVFMPSVSEMYPVKDNRVFHFGNLENVMEGPNRPGHFNGVAQVVSRLFDIVQPDMAFFGQKDFQQVAIIQDMVRQLNLKVKIVPCPIIREPDGLAMSSRNRLLLPEHRKNAGQIYETLLNASEMSKGKDISEIKTFVVDKINSISGFRTEYFEIVESVSLTPLNSKADLKERCRYFGCIALYAGAIRLIDNIELKFK